MKQKIVQLGVIAGLMTSLNAHSRFTDLTQSNANEVQKEKTTDTIEGAIHYGEIAGEKIESAYSASIDYSSQAIEDGVELAKRTNETYKISLWAEYLLKQTIIANIDLMTKVNEVSGFDVIQGKLNIPMQGLGTLGALASIHYIQKSGDRALTSLPNTRPAMKAIEKMKREVRAKEKALRAAKKEFSNAEKSVDKLEQKMRVDKNAVTFETVQNVDSKYAKAESAMKAAKSELDAAYVKNGTMLANAPGFTKQALSALRSATKTTLGLASIAGLYVIVGDSLVLSLDQSEVEGVKARLQEDIAELNKVLK